MFMSTGIIYHDHRVRRLRPPWSLGDVRVRLALPVLQTNSCEDFGLGSFVEPKW